MDSLKTIKEELNKFRKNHTSVLKETEEMAEHLIDACGQIESSWSGSFAGWHGRMYFRDFEIPSIHEQFNGEWGGIHGIPDGWEEKRAEEVEARINVLVGKGFSVKGFEDGLPKLREEAVKLRDEVVINFSGFPFDKGTAKEKELVEIIEKKDFGNTKAAYIQRGLPKSMMTRDSEAIRQGMCIPSWLYYRGVALEAGNLPKEIRDLMSSVEKIVRQLEIKSQSGVKMSEGKLLDDLHPKIYEKCRSLYEKGEYPEAVEKGFKVVRDRLRELTGYETGSEAFGKTKLHIRGAAATNVDEDFNQGIKFLAMAIDRFRNEKSHTSDAKIDDPVRAYEYLRISSLCMNLLENSEILS